MVLTNVRYLVRISLEKIYHFSSNGSHSMETFNTVGTRKPDSKTIYGIQHSGTGKPDPKTIYGIQHSWDRETRLKDHIMGKDHIWDSTLRDRETTIEFNTVGTGKPDSKTIYGIQHSGTGKPDSKTIYGQRPYMGFNTAGQGNDHRIQHNWDRKTRLKNHIWTKTIYGIQHSWDRETRLKDHIWAKTIYGIQHSETGKPDPKTIEFNTVGTGKPDSKTIYRQRPYMGFNTARQGNQIQRPYMGKDHIWDSTQLGQGNQTQRPYMGKDHIWDSTQRDRETRPKDHRIQHSWDRKTRSKDHIMGKDHIWDSTLRDRETTIEFNTVGTGKPDSKTIYGQRPYMGFNTAGQGNQTQRPYMGKDYIWDSTQQDRETDSKTIEFNTVGTGKPDSKTIYGQRPYMGFNTARQGNQTQRP